MNTIDWIGFAGVTLLLVAYFLNLIGKLNEDTLPYMLLNFFGAAIACTASAILRYIPFIVLEGAWALISLVAVVNYFRTHRTKT